MGCQRTTVRCRNIIGFIKEGDARLDTGRNPYEGPSEKLLAVLNS